MESTIVAKLTWVSAALCVLCSCGGSGDAGRTDGSPRDAARTDSAARDGATRDAATDGAAVDASMDAGTPVDPLAWEDCEGSGRTLEAGPDDYRAVLDTLMPGDTLRLRPGDYARGLPLRISGEPGRCIVVEALDSRNRPRFLGSDSFNIIAVHGASWLKVRHLDIDGMGRAGFGVASQGGTDSPTHHVVIEDLTMVGLGADQQIDGISTKSPAWDWVIRGNHITGAGTGLYLGNSDGNQPFVRGLIERNVVIDTIGYCMQIKHQNPRPDLPGIPTNAVTIIRDNVFAKTSGFSSGGMARPNLLLGHFPTSGAGQDDRYLVYRNFFFDNPVEMLMQAEGNLAIYDNLFVNPHGGALTVQPHNDVPRLVDVFFNTVVAMDRGVRVTGGAPAFAQRVRANAIFAGRPLSADDEAANITGSVGEASAALVAPADAPGGGLDLHPMDGSAALDVTLDAAEIPDVPEFDFDFDARPRSAGVAGAYSGAGLAGAWSPNLDGPPR